MDLGSEYKLYCDRFKAVWRYLEGCSKGFDEIVSDICKLRLYFGEEERWGRVLSETGVVFVSESTCDYSRLNKEEFKDLALFSKEGKFLLNERYILPVRDMLGNIIALIGWYPDSKKYITTPSRFFVRDCLFFGLEQVGEVGIGKPSFIVEGIFDSLSLRSLGYNAYAQMGIADSRVKVLLYGLFGKVVAIPDNDSQGRKVLKNDKWDIPQSGSYFRWVGEVPISEEDRVYVKDIDRLCSLFDEDSMKQVLDSCLESKSRHIKINIG